MARQLKLRERLPVIAVFWEGESEEQYIEFLRKEFRNYVNFKIYSKKGTFSAAKKAFSKSGMFVDIKDEIDAVWIIFDTEIEQHCKYEEFCQISENLRGKRKPLFVKWLMTKGCIEYFFLLHYCKTASEIATPADKEKILQKLKDSSCCPTYKKGDKDSIRRIAKGYEVAYKNGCWCMENIKEEIGSIVPSKGRDKKLFLTDKTFSVVHEGIEYLIGLKEKRLAKLSC